jgi:ferredoxin-thioredoxin reductase catalytic subunit
MTAEIVRVLCFNLDFFDTVKFIICACVFPRQINQNETTCCGFYFQSQKSSLRVCSKFLIKGENVRYVKLSSPQPLNQL